MHKRFIPFFAVFLFSASRAEALLPPLYESIRELSAILADRELSSYLSGSESIQSIKLEEGGYRIDGTHSSCFVKIIPTHSGKIGPMEFTLQFQTLEPAGDLID